MESISQIVYKDEREDIQKKTFCKWVNSQLSKANKSLVTDLFYDLRDGSRLISLLEVLTAQKYKRERGSMRVHQMSNVNTALKILDEQQVKLVNINSDQIVDGSPKITLGLVWSIILHWQVHSVLKEVMADLKQTNLEKTLLAWCRQMTKDYQSVEIKNFTTSWTDGLAFNAILHHSKPQLFDWTVLVRRHPYARLEHAFRIAHEHFGIERLLDPEDVNTQVPDKKSVMMYVMCLFQALPYSSFTMESLNISVQSDSSFSVDDAEEGKGRPVSLVSIGLGSYQQTLEEVLTWLLEAEDKLASMPPIASTTKNVKSQFHELEEIMLELTQRQSSIGDVLSEGSKLLRENLMGDEEANEVRMQMKLLNTRWEDLRIKAMDRQSSLHEELMKLQQEELETLRKWLTLTEDRIANMSELGPYFEKLLEQIKAHEKLQSDIEAEQDSINSLSNMVVVVDDTGSDSVYAALEDELNALGERWTHICKWAEKRWATLQSLHTNWGGYEREKKKLEDWITTKEKDLREIESNPEAGHEEIFQQAVSLKVLKTEMDIENGRFNFLQDTSNIILEKLTPDSPAHTSIPEEIEMLQDRLECLTSILEAQTQRIIASGVDLKTVDVETSEMDSTDELRRSKRQKVSSSRMTDFSVSVDNTRKEFDVVEGLISDAYENNDPENLEVVLSQIELKVKELETEHENLVVLGQEAICDLKTNAESPVETEAKLSSFKNRWMHITRNAQILREKTSFLRDVHKLEKQFVVSKDERSSVENWINKVQSVTSYDSSSVQELSNECQENKNVIQRNISSLNELREEANKLSFTFSSEKENFISNIQALLFEWQNLVMRISNWEMIFEDQSKSESQMAMESSDVIAMIEHPEICSNIEDLNVWLSNVEEALESSTSFGPITVMEENLGRLKTMQEKVDPERVKLTELNERVHGIESLSTRVEELNTKWNKVIERLNNRTTEVEKGIEKQKQFKVETTDLRTWLSEVEAFLAAEEAAVGDVETLKAQLHESNALLDDIATLKVTVKNIMDTGRLFITQYDGEQKKEIERELEELKSRWDNSVTKSNKQNTKLKEALEKSVEFQNGITELSIWLDLAESRDIDAIETTSELNTAYESVQELRAELMKKAVIYQKISELAEDMTSEEEANKIETIYNPVNTKYTQISEHIIAKEASLLAAKENYDVFKKLCYNETVWLDQLEAKLEKSTDGAADAEEISAALDELDSHIRSHDSHNFDKIQKIAEDLISRGVMTVVVQNATHSLSSRFDLLNAKAHEQQLKLEGGVQEAQELEREYVATLDRLSDAHLVLMPPQVDQLKEVEKELNGSTEVMEKIRKRIDKYTAQGRTQAASRLSAQLDHLLKQYEEIEEKHKLAQEINTYDIRLLNVTEILTEVDKKTKTEVNKSIQPDDIEGNLNHCMELYKSLSEVKGEVESIIATGRRLVKVEMAPEPETLTATLDQLKELYNDLGSTVTEQRGRLESGYRHSRKVFKDLPMLEEFFANAEKDLDKREVGKGKLELEQLFAKNLSDDTLRKKSLIASIQESLDNLINIYGKEATEDVRNRLSDVSDTYERLQTRLHNRLDKLKDEGDKKDSGMETFILKIGEIKAWLEEAERKTNAADKVPYKDREAALKKVRVELEEYKKEIQIVQNTATNLIEHGTLFQSRLEPELDSISKRWHQIYESIKDKSMSDGEENSSMWISKIESYPLSETKMKPLHAVSIHDFRPSNSFRKSFPSQESFLSSQTLSRPKSEVLSFKLKSIKTPIYSFNLSSLDNLSETESFVDPVILPSPLILGKNRKLQERETKIQKLRSKWVDSETEPENLDDIIFSLKKVARKEALQPLIKTSKEPINPKIIKDIKNTLSPRVLRKIKKDDDDLESLASIETDAAPVSETSRGDMECTYSDLESVSSVPVKGLDDDDDRAVPSKLAMELSKRFAKSLPVQKLQEMIAELEVSLSSSQESFHSIEKFPSVKEINRDSADRSSTRSVSLKQIFDLDVNKKRSSLDETCHSPSRSDGYKKRSSLDEICHPPTGTDFSELKNSSADENRKSPAHIRINPIDQKRINNATSSNSGEFTVREIHVPGRIEFAKASITVETDKVNASESGIQVLNDAEELFTDRICEDYGDISYPKITPSKLSESCELTSSKLLLAEIKKHKERQETFEKSSSFVEMRKSSEHLDIEEYFKEVSAMIDVISGLREKGNSVKSYKEALMLAQEFERDVASIEPDVATLISRGDTLTLKTHMIDVAKSNSVRLAVDDFRTCWMSLKAQTEALKLEVSKVLNEIKLSGEKLNYLTKWLNDTNARVQMANNTENEVKVLSDEVKKKRVEIDELNAANEMMLKYEYTELSNKIEFVNKQYGEINRRLSQYQKDTNANDYANMLENKAIVPDFLAGVNRIRESISSLSRQLHGSSLSKKPYDELTSKEEELKRIKKDLEYLQPKVDNVETERLNTIKNATKPQTDQVRRIIDKLREEWAQVNRNYNAKHELWIQCSENWNNFNQTLADFATWLDCTEIKLKDTVTQSKIDASNTQKEIEKQITLKHRPSQTLQSLCKDISTDISPPLGSQLQVEVSQVLKRWRALLVDVAARREKLAQEEMGVVKNPVFDAVVLWINQAQALMDASVNVTDESALSAHRTIVKGHLQSMEGAKTKLSYLQKSRYEGTKSMPMKTTEINLAKLSKTFSEYAEKIDTKLNVISTLVIDAEELYKWIEQVTVKVSFRTPTGAEVKQIRSELEEKNNLYETLDHTYWALAQDAESKGYCISEMLKTRMNSIENRLKSIENQFSTEDPIKLVKVKAVGQSSESRIEPGTTVTPCVANVIHNVVKLEESVLENKSSLSSKISDPNSPTLILAALDKSILQIRDWLTLMEQMSRNQTTVVGDDDDIRRLIEKQRSVLRELEGKKPQLDELVSSADGLKNDESRVRMHEQVSKLREHWDETNSHVLTRKTQLDAMLSDTQKFDAKRLELENWLSRMESRIARMSTSDSVDHQIREQKLFQGEILQNRHQIELFNQMTQKLCTIYANDDTRRVKKASESINQRFNSLSTSINSRGIQSAGMSAGIHGFNKASDKFLTWIADAEASCNRLIGDVEQTGSSRRSSRPYLHHKDLQSEIENRKDVLASLNATGQKILGTLENQDDAVALHRQLEEMNHRWNSLKHNSIAIRHRLEGTADNWNSLLLSLRELIEWVIRKDTELTAIGSPIGDMIILAKHEQDLLAFSRSLDEKQPIVESNLKSGRQLIASEPPLSDTSDSEAGRDLEGDSRYRGEDSARDLTRAVRREVSKLSEKWAALRERITVSIDQAALAFKKLGVLLKTVEEVGSRLAESEKALTALGPINDKSEQEIPSIRKIREKLPELQRGIDDVNDQAARFSIHNVPLTPANSSALHDLNSRWKSLETAVSDRWRQVAGRSRDLTPLTPAQLATSVNQPWERATATNKVPYYINHAQETTHWDHPEMIQLLDSLCDFNHIKFSAYRTASKLRALQKKLALDLAKLQLVSDIFDEHGLRGQNDRLIDVNDMIVVLSTLYGRISSDHPVDPAVATDLCLNWLLNVYDSQRTGQMRVLSFRVGLICLCRGHLEEKYRYMFRLIADPNRQADQRKLGLLLHDCVQVPRQLGEVAAFGGSNIEPSVRSCFLKAGKDKETIEAVHFLSWVQQEPQSLVWLAVLHRVAASESVHHQAKCNICKTYPIIGLRYRCLKCLSFDMCQRCFFDGKSSKSHKITHPMHEYCAATTAGDEMKDFTKALKNKFKSKRSLQKHTKKGYLPVQTVLEGDALESPSPSPSHVSHDMHSRLELYASRLAEVEHRNNATPDSEDEHGLIAQYCNSLNSFDGNYPVPKSPLQIMASVDADQKDELEQMIRDLEEENRALQAEYDRLASQQPEIDENGIRTEAEMRAEAKLLREHKGRLEARMAILEDHNRQLEAQLNRLRNLLSEHSGVGSPNKSGTLQTKSVTASQLAMDSPAKVNGHSGHGDLEKAVGQLVASMNQETENGSLNGDDRSDKT